MNYAITPASRQVNHQEIYIMKPVKILSAALVISALLVALSGCEKQEGPIQDAAKGDKK